VFDAVNTLNGQVLSLKYYIPTDVLQRDKTFLVILQQQTRVSEVFSSVSQQWKNDTLNIADSQPSESSMCHTTCPISDSVTTSTSSASIPAADNSEHVQPVSIKLCVSPSATSSEQSKDTCVVIIPENKNVRDKVHNRTPASPGLADESRSSANDRVVKVTVVDNGPKSSPMNISAMCFITLIFVQNVGRCAVFCGTIQYRWSGHKDYGGAGSTLSVTLTMNDDNDFCEFYFEVDNVLIVCIQYQDRYWNIILND
jgi:hypothetical protein